MRDYAEIAHNLRCCGVDVPCDDCTYQDDIVKCGSLERQAADAIEELLKICAKMRTWIFLHAADEQAAYDEIGLTDEQNALFGYSGQMILKAAPPNKEETE